jgi:hypothetical protein
MYSRMHRTPPSRSGSPQPIVVLPTPPMSAMSNSIQHEFDKPSYRISWNVPRKYEVRWYRYGMNIMGRKFRRKAGNF